jgi:hypothetical protein
MEIKKGSDIVVPHGDREIQFRWYSTEGTYVGVNEQLDKSSSRMPASAEIASLVYDAYQNSEGYPEEKIIKYLWDPGFWESTGNLLLPKSNGEINNGVILEKFPWVRVKDREIVMDKGTLIERLKENDPLVKFVPFGFKTQNLDWQDLEKNPYIIARYGEAGAEKLAKIVSERRGCSSYLGFNSFINPPSLDHEESGASSLHIDKYAQLRIGIGDPEDSIRRGVFSTPKFFD